MDCSFFLLSGKQRFPRNLPISLPPVSLDRPVIWPLSAPREAGKASISGAGSVAASNRTTVLLARKRRCNY